MTSIIQVDNEFASKSQESLSARDRVRLGRSWARGGYTESLVAVQNTKFMPRLQVRKGGGVW